MKSLGQGLAHAKVILIGEHAVVYGHPGIALPFLPLTLAVKVEPNDEDALHSEWFVGLMVNLPQELMFIKFLVDELRTFLHYGPVTVTIQNHIPSSAGMGSSAALSSALVQALYDFAEVPLTPAVRFEKTQLAEKLVHGAASGIDALTTTADHAWYFVKGKDPLPINVHLPGLLVVANSGIKGSTKEAVGKVAKLFTQNLAQGHLESLGLMTLLTKEAIEKQSLEEVARYLNQAHFHLQELGVSHPKVDAMVAACLRLGALGAKMTGGGLGGSMIALCETSAIAAGIIEHIKTHYTQEVWLMDLNQ
ncbi:MAG: mevalonate kinase [Bacilli bacterium]